MNMNENELKAAIEAKAKELEELKEMMASLVNEQQKKRDELKKKAELLNLICIIPIILFFLHFFSLLYHHANIFFITSMGICSKFFL